MKAQNFNEDDWEFEMSSGNRGYRHEDNGDWIYEEEYLTMKKRKEEYERDFNLLHEFRRDCLPFGKYADYVLLEFLEKKV